MAVSRVFSRLWNAIGSWWTPAIWILLVVVTAVVIQTTPVLTTTFGDSGRNFPMQILAALSAIVLLVWLLMTNRVGFPSKAIVLCLVSVMAVGQYFAIRKIEFTGNNIPIIHWKWSTATKDQQASADSIAAQDRLADPPVEDALLAGASCPGFLGANRDGVIEVIDISVDWETNPPKERWRAPIGAGYAAFVVKGRVAVTIEQQGPREVVAAYDAETGKPLWWRAYPARFTETMGGDGPRATPTIDGDLVYALGATGILSCIDLKSGKLEWETDILADAKANNITWGMSGSPLVVDDLVIVNPGGKDGHGLAAYDKEKGKLVWSGGNYQAAYSSPVHAVLGGVRQALILDQNGIAGHDLESGKELWRHEFKVVNDINVADPLVLSGDRVFISASYGGGCAMLKVEQKNGKWAATELWKSPTVMRCKFTSPVLVDGYLYGLDDGVLVCVDAETGKRKWKNGRYGHGQILCSGKRIFVQCENGEFAIVEADPKKFHELAKIRVLPGEKNWNAPAIAGERLLVRNHYEMAAFDLPVADTKSVGKTE